MRLASFTGWNISYGDGVDWIVRELKNYVRGHAGHSLIVFHHGGGDEKAPPPPLSQLVPIRRHGT